ncbi:MAG TPA: ornithine cyclodeaminase family protein, partial [Fimbriimonas sp.]
TGFLLLHDATTGELLSLMDAEHLTAMRTGAASAIATDLLALKDASVATVFGTGAQAETQLEGVCRVRPIRSVYAVGRDDAKTEAFAKTMADRLGCRVEATSDRARAVRESQIVCTATTSVEPVFAGSDVQPGTHINAVGAFREDMRELDEDVIQRARVYVDQIEAAKRGAGEIIQPVLRGTFSWDRLAGELGGLINRRLAGRESRDEITVFKSVGVSVQDAFVARSIFEQASNLDLGKLVDLH